MMSDLTWEDVKEWKHKQYDCDGRLIQFDDDCINWLMTEVEQLRAEVKSAYISGYNAGHNDTVEGCYTDPESRADDYLREVDDDTWR